jgi:hypothetical protein
MILTSVPLMRAQVVYVELHVLASPSVRDTSVPVDVTVPVSGRIDPLHWEGSCFESSSSF